MSSEKTTQVRVGLFMLIGLAGICAMVVYFGRFGEGLQKFYDLRVEYPNASGLFQGADVLLAGAKVGKVKQGPVVLRSMRGVYVILKIQEGVQIPQGSSFTIGSAGLLGDSYVDITMPQNLDIEHYVPITAGSTVIGKRDGSGIAELAGEGSELIADVRTAIKHIDTVVTRVNTEILDKQNVAAVNQTLENLKSSTGQFTDASKKLGDVADQAGTAMKNLSEAVSHITVTADKTTDTLDATKDAALSFNKTMVQIRLLVQDARNGKGVLGTLISNRALADNLQALVANLRSHGVLWYKNSPAPKKNP